MTQTSRDRPAVSGPLALAAALIALAGGCHLIFPFDPGTPDTGVAAPDASSDANADAGSDAVVDAAWPPVEASVELGPPISDAPSPSVGLTHDWSRRLGGKDSDEAQAVAVDGMGDVHVTGFFMGELHFNSMTSPANNLTDFFLARYSPKGAELAMTVLTDTSRAVGRSLVIEPPSNILVMGSFNKQLKFKSGVLSTTDNKDDLVLVRFNPAGVPEGVAFKGADYDNPRRLLRDGSGHLYMVGEYRSDLSFGTVMLTSTAGSADAFVASVDAGGKHRWTKSIGGMDDDYGRGAAMIPGGGGIVVTGSLKAAKNTSVDLGGGPLNHNGGADIYLISYTTTGVHSWSKLLGGPGADEGYAVAVDGSGNVYVTGSVTGGVDLGGGVLPSWSQTDIFVASFDKAGKHRWSKTMGSGNRERGGALVIRPGGPLFVLGQHQGGLAFGSTSLLSQGSDDIFTASLAPKTGAPQWARGYGGPGDDVVLDAALAPDGGLYVVGSYDNSVNFGGGTLPNADSYTEGFLLKLKPQ